MGGLPPGFGLILAEAYRKNHRPAEGIAALDEGMKKGRFLRQQGKAVLEEYGQSYAEKADQHYKAGEHKKAIVDFDKAAKYLRHPMYRYHAALAAVAGGDIKTALDRLDTAYDMGLQDWRGMSGDDRLAVLRTEPRFKALVAKMRKRSPDFEVKPHKGHDH